MLKIDIKEYLSESELKSICEDEFRSAIKRHFKDESAITRIISNIAYTSVYKMIDDVIDDDLSKILYKKASEVISKIDTYSVFRKKDAWGYEDSKATILLNQALEMHKHKFNEKVLSLIENKNYENDIDEYFLESLKSVIIQKLEQKTTI